MEEDEALIPQEISTFRRDSQSFLFRKCLFLPVFFIIFTLFYFGVYLQSGDFIAQFQLAAASQPDLYYDDSIFSAEAKSDSSETKVILFWTKFFDNENPFLRDKLSACKEKKCFLTDDRRYLNRSSAVIFHIRDLNVADLPEFRTEKQLFVFFLLESPNHIGSIHLDQPPWPGFFNLTWTYRLDSDIFCPFYLEKFQPKMWINRNFSREFLRKKNEKALIFSSNCKTPSRRENYIDQLRRHFPVDIIGACGQMSCPRSDKECENRAQIYKFYLSFENSNCKDYMTEKVIRPFNLGTVPVVLGGGNYSGIFPPHSFIDTAHFKSPKKLADYLSKLVRDFDLYEKYYDWKLEAKYAKLPSLIDPAQTSVCKLCQILHNDSFPPKRYDDIHNWWSKEAACQSGP